MPLYSGSSGSSSSDQGQVMAAVQTVSSKLDQSLSIGQANSVAITTLSSSMDTMRQQISDLLVGAGVPDSVAAQVDQLLILQQVTQTAITAALAKLATPLPPPTPLPIPAPTITLAVNTLAGTSPGSVQLNATVSADVTKVECYQDGALIFTKNAAPFGYTVTGLAAGTFKFTEKAFGPGGTMMSNEVSVTIATATGPVLIGPL